MTEAGKKFADFVECLNGELLELAGKSEGKLDNEQVGEMIKEIIVQLGSELNERSASGKLSIDYRTFGLLMDVTSNFIFMDNMRLCSAYKDKQDILHRTLLQRMDMTWAYFREIVDSFALARGLTHNAQHKQEENQ